MYPNELVKDMKSSIMKKMTPVTTIDETEKVDDVESKTVGTEVE